MVELGKFLRREKNKVMAALFLGGAMLGAAGFIDLTSTGADKFNEHMGQCVKGLTQIDPPVYTLKNPTDFCLRLEQGVPSQTIIAEFDQQIQKGIPWALARGIGGGVAVGGSLAVGISDVMARRRRQVAATSAE